MISSSVLPPIRVTPLSVILLVLLATSSVRSSQETKQTQTSKIQIDSMPHKYQSIEVTEKETKKIQSTPPAQTTSSSLKIFEFFLKSLAQVCPCNSELVSIDFENDEHQTQYLEFLESQKEPERIVENTGRLLESTIKQEIENLKKKLVLQKQKSLEEVTAQKKRLISEMVKRSLLKIANMLDLIVHDSSNYLASVEVIAKKVELMQRLESTDYLKHFYLVLKAKLSYFVKHYMLEEKVHVSIDETLWKYFPRDKLNAFAKKTFSPSDLEANSGMRLVMENGMCLASESDAVKYLRFLDSIWASTEKDNLYDTHRNKVVFVYKKLVNLHLFQNLFKDLAPKDLDDPRYFSIYSFLYIVILEMRVANADVELTDEFDALQKLIEFINDRVDKVFKSEDEKEDYLLLKTIIYKRLQELHHGEVRRKDYVDGSVVVDHGLPLSFYVKRKEDRTLLKDVVEKNNLSINLNILKYKIDELKSHEDFLAKAKDILYEYLDQGLELDADSEDVQEIFMNLSDLLEKTEKGSERGDLLRIYSIRYVYYKFHFNYVYGIETAPKKFGIVNMKRMPFLREVLEITLDFVSDKINENTRLIFKAVQPEEDPLEDVYDQIALFLEENAKQIAERLVKPAVDQNVVSVENLCQLYVMDFKLFLPEEKQGVSREIVKMCESVAEYHDVTSFRRKYFFLVVKWLSLARTFRGYSEKKHMANEWVEIYSSATLFREYGPMLSHTKYHLALEYDYFLNRESIEPKYLKEVQSLSFGHRYKYFDIIKIANLKNLLHQESVLFKTSFTFIYFKKMTHVLRFFNLKEAFNQQLFERIYGLFRDLPRYYHLNNVYLLLRLQFHQDSGPAAELQSRLLDDYSQINSFSEERIPGSHARSQVLASRIAVIYFYTIYLQSCLERECKSEAFGDNWANYDEFLQTVLTNEDQRIQYYFFTDYLYENLNTDVFQSDFSTVEYSRESFVKEAEGQPRHVLGRRALTSWAVDYLRSLNYANSSARFFENALYDFFKELLKGRHFDKANEYKDVVIRNVLAFHRRNGSKVFGDLHRRFFASLEPNPKLPTQRNMDLLLFNCVSEYVAYMNSPDKKYHHFDEVLVHEKFEKYIIYYFKEKGGPFNPKMHMPRTEQHLNISGYAVPGIVSLFSIFDFSLEKHFKQEVFGKLLQTFEFIAWSHFTIPNNLSRVSSNEAWNQNVTQHFQKLRKDFKTHELNNLVVQNLEGFFRPICRFENALVTARFIDSPKSLEKMEATVNECLDIAKRSGLTEAKVILAKLVRTFYMPAKYYQDSAVVFETDPIPEWLENVKKLFSRVTLVAQDLVSFPVFAQMIQKVLSSSAKVINSNFQVFLNEVVSANDLESLISHLDSEVSAEGLLNVESSLMPKAVAHDAALKQYFKNSVMYDVLTLISIDEETFAPNKKLWSYDFFHLLNRKSNYSAFLTNLFQNYSQGNPAPMHTLYLLVCKFKLVTLLKQKQRDGKVDRNSVMDSSMSVNSMNKLQEEITISEAPKFNVFMNNLITKEKSKESPDAKLLSDLFYFKTINVDINLVDMAVFEMSEEYAVNIVEDIRDVLENSDGLDKEEVQSILKEDPELTNNLGFYFQEASKLKGYVDRYGDIEDKFDNVKDADLVDNHVQYLADFIALFQNVFGLTVSEDQTMMYQRNLKTVLFKFEAKVVF